MTTAIAINGVCVACETNCAVCSDVDTCTQCAAGGFTLANGNCPITATCETGYEANTNNECALICNDANCDVCSAVDTCTTCDSAYHGADIFFSLQRLTLLVILD